MDPKNLTDEEREALTAEEREALEYDDAAEEADATADGEDDDDASPPANSADADAAAKAEADEEAARKEKEAADADLTEDEKAAAAKAAEETKAKVEAQDPPAGDALPAFVPLQANVPLIPVPAEATKRIDDAKAERTALAVKFDEGELTAKEYREQDSKLEEEIADLRQTIYSAKHSIIVNESNFYDKAIPAFFKSHPIYAEEAENPLRDALDAQLKKLQQKAENPFDPALLVEAHKEVDARMRKAYGISDAPAPAPGKKPAPKREVVPTLGGLPAADMTPTDGDGEFAGLDRLAEKDPEAFERALAKMSDEQRDRYLQSA